MSIFTALTNAYSLEDAFKAKDITSRKMKTAIEEWFRLYYEEDATKDSDPCQRIAPTIVSKLTKTCFGEYQATSKDEFAQSVLDALSGCKREAMQMLLVGGETFIKPVPDAGKLIFRVVRRDQVLVFGRNADGAPCDIGMFERSTLGSKYYTLLERRSIGTGGRLTIQNTLYCSHMEGQLGQPVPLQMPERYAALLPEYTYPAPMGGLGLVHMQVPIENAVDGSQDGISVYAAAVGLIHNINRNEAQINGEFERGESRIVVSSTMMGVDSNGRRKLTDNVFVGVDGDPEDIGVNIFSPDLRIQQFHERKREYLRNVESVIGIKRGLLSEVEAQERTAKEVTSSEGDYNLTIIDLQEVWTKAAKDAVKLCGILGKLYKIPGARDVPEDAVAIDFGDGVLYNREKVGQEMLAQVQSGLLAPERYLGWYYNLPCDTPEQRRKIRKEYMPEMAQMEEGGEE